jgi:hypothetical protein
VSALLVIPAQAGIQGDIARLSRYRQVAAYAASVSTTCRPPSHFSLAGPREK